MIIVPTPEKLADNFRRKAARTAGVISCAGNGKPGDQVAFRSPLGCVLAVGKVQDTRPGAFTVKISTYYV